jgi:hypothetical protein
MPRRVVLDENTKRLIGGILDKCGVAGMMRGTYYSFGVKIQSLIRHNRQADINDAIKYYQDRFGANPSILRIIADKMQGKPTTEQC